LNQPFLRTHPRQQRQEKQHPRQPIQRELALISWKSANKDFSFFRFFAIIYITKKRKNEKYHVIASFNMIIIYLSLPATTVENQ
jgi:hypothetical protein